MPAAKYSLKSGTDRQRFKESLADLDGVDWSEKPEQYCDYRLDGKASGGWLRAKQFSNGTLYLEASTDPLLALMTTLMDNGGAQAQLIPAKVKSSKPENGTPRGLLDIQGSYIGTDESGKGDYFGPLVVAGGIVTDKTKPILAELGVMDSKKLTDQRIGELYSEIIAVVGENGFNTVEIGPTKYNELYARFKSNGRNLNHMLAWGHATVLENLLTRFPDCHQAIADQFGGEHYILSQLKEKGKQITLHQTPKAEANIGVAAASMIARYRFTQRLKQLSNRFGVNLPFGAGPNVKVQAKRLISTHGEKALSEVAKLHFKTTAEITGGKSPGSV